MRKHALYLAAMMGLMLVCAPPMARGAQEVIEYDADATPVGTPEHAGATASAAQDTCRTYDAVFVWNRSNVTVTYLMWHPVIANGQWVPITLLPNHSEWHAAYGTRAGQQFVVAYDANICSAGTHQWSFFYPGPGKAAYRCTLQPAGGEGYWYQIYRANTCVIGLQAY